MTLSTDPWKPVRVAGLACSLEMFETLYDGPKRFADLKQACPNESTRTERLRLLEEEGYVKIETAKIKRRNFVYYMLTDRGKAAVEHFIAVRKLFL